MLKGLDVQVNGTTVQELNTEFKKFSHVPRGSSTAVVNFAGFLQLVHHLTNKNCAQISDFAQKLTLAHVQEAKDSDRTSPRHSSVAGGGGERRRSLGSSVRMSATSEICVIQEE